MTDPLTIGSDRLMTRILVAESRGSPVADAIKADPGIVSLVEFAEAYKVGWDGAGVSPLARAALKLWEHGK